MRTLDHVEIISAVDAIKRYDVSRNNKRRGLWWTVGVISLGVFSPSDSWRLTFRAEIKPFFAELRNALRPLSSFEFVQQDDEALSELVDFLIMVKQEERNRNNSKERIFTRDEIAEAIKIFKDTKPGIWEKLKIAQMRELGGYGTPEHGEIMKSFHLTIASAPFLTDEERKDPLSAKIIHEIVMVAQK